MVVPFLTPIVVMTFGNDLEEWIFWRFQKFTPGYYWYTPANCLHPSATEIFIEIAFPFNFLCFPKCLSEFSLSSLRIFWNFLVLQHDVLTIISWRHKLWVITRVISRVCVFPWYKLTPFTVISNPLTVMRVTYRDT